jgi:aryl-alcohol dehydrogenase-like predicted oxidoreductase
MMSNDEQRGMNRRQFLQGLGVTALAACLPPGVQAGTGGAITKAIPGTGEMLPVIGMGSARTFDVGDDPDERAPLLKVLQAFFDYGGMLIDSSPMYGNAEQVIGDLLQKVNNRQKLFAATKVWTDGKQSGIEQMQRSMQRMRVAKFDLMQIHNLRDWEVHLETLKDWKASGKIRYIGITTSHGRFHNQLQTILEMEEAFDFVQFSYNIGNRDVEQHLLPLAIEQKLAVLINRPYMKGALFRSVKGKTLPGWAKEFDCTSWGQFFLKFVVSHPAVTCAIPATTKVHHMIDNMAAGFGRLPDAAMRMRMLRYFEGL